MSIEAMKLALEALQLSKPKLTENTFRYVAHDLAIAALRAAIEQAKPWVKTYAGGEPQYTTPEEQPEQEPVAWRYRGNLHEFDPSDWAEGPVTPLYATPPRREWQGLTDEEADELIRRFARYELLRAIEAKLREKNT